MSLNFFPDCLRPGRRHRQRRRNSPGRCARSARGARSVRRSALRQLILRPLREPRRCSPRRRPCPPGRRCPRARSRRCPLRGCSRRGCPVPILR